MTARSSPVVSVIIANHNGGAFIEDALASAARQTLADIEILVVDDASTDDSARHVQAFSARDPRVRLIRLERRTGPGGARNRGLLAATGRWIAVLDSDDLMHPRRLAALVDAAASAGAQLAADNQMVFDNQRRARARPLLSGHQCAAAATVRLEHYIDSNRLFSRGMPLGYLKPLILRSFMETAGCRYDAELVIAEDYDLVLRLLLAGGRFVVLPDMTYFYRRHSGSISHRLSASSLLPMLAADDALRAAPGCLPQPVTAALDRRRRTIGSALCFDALVEAIKQRRWLAALRLAARRPDVAALLRVPLRDRLRRLAQPRRRAFDGLPRDRVTLISRQRITGPTNGSSAYLLSLCGTLRQAGYEIDLISPSPAMFGRWPFLRLDPAMDMFAAIRIRGAWRMGRIVIARDPRIALRAASAVVRRLLGRLHLGLARPDRKSAHAIAVPLTDADRRFVADAARRSSLILTDYAFLNETIPFTLQPGVPSAVVMHDLFSAQDPARTVIRLDQAAEMALLDQADAVIAIQGEEAAMVRRWLPRKHVILAPMAVSPVAEAQPGEDGTVLFVGSNTTPNLEGIAWFLREVWPRVLELAPAARLRVAGTCCAGLSSGPQAGVSLLGKVDDLDRHYREAAVVISPLRLGSGLKIKLVEALGRGKAVIATETTLQGVKHLVQGALVQADQASEFLAAFASLLHDRPSRLRFGTEALRVARCHFSEAACTQGLLTFARSAGRCAEGASGRPTAAGDMPHTGRVLAE